MSLGGPQCGTLGAERLGPGYCHFDPYSVPMKKTGEAFPPHVTEGETEGQKGMIVSGISGPPPSSRHWDGRQE